MSEFTFDVESLETPALEMTDPELVGEDISLLNGEMTETDNGDITVVTGRLAALQSATRETINNPGSFPRRPEWGAGVQGLLFKGMTSNTRDRAVSRTRARLLVNPRIVKVNSVQAFVSEGKFKVAFDCDSFSGPVRDTVIVKPPGF
jgi:phage baseplate assembly protein W